MESLLELKQVEAFIQHYHILHDISFEVPKSEVTVLLGRNGAGKTTTLRTIMGLNQVSKGTVRFKGEEISNRSTHQIANRGIGYVPEDQGIFNGLTVGENMRVAMKKKTKKQQNGWNGCLNCFRI